MTTFLAVGTFLWHRFHDDFWPLDHSNVGPNIAASIAWSLGAVVAVYVFWRPLRDRVNAWLARILQRHHFLHLAPHHDAALEHLLAIRQSVEQLLHLASPAAPLPAASPITKEIPMGIFSNVIAELEHRFNYHPNKSALVAKAHEDIRSVFVTASKDLLAIAATVAPETRELSLALTKLEEADQWFHAHVARNQPVVVATPAPAPAPEAAPAPVVPAAAPMAPTPPAPVATAPVVPAPVAPAPVPEAPVAAPAPAVVDPALPPPANGGVAS